MNRRRSRSKETYRLWANVSPSERRRLIDLLCTPRSVSYGIASGCGLDQGSPVGGALVSGDDSDRGLVVRVCERVDGE